VFDEVQSYLNSSYTYQDGFYQTYCISMIIISLMGQALGIWYVCIVNFELV